MSYENAPATILLATHCAVCGRPLVDAKSVEVGIGPDCRRKHGFDIDVPEEARGEANKLVHDLALLVSRGAVRELAGDLLSALPRLRVLGFTKLAGVLEERAAAVRVEEQGDRLAVWTPFTPCAVEGFRRIGGRRWDAERKCNTFPCVQRGLVWSVLRECFPGTLGKGPRGLFVIEAPGRVQAAKVAKAEQAERAVAVKAGQDEPFVLTY